MTTKRYSPECMDRHFIALGKEGEGNHLALRFDTAVWREAYPEAEILLWVTPPVGEGYFAELAEQSGDVIWTVTSGDTEHKGEGEIELILRDKSTGTTIKSATARTLIKKSPSHGKGGNPPEAHNPWWEKVIAAIRGVVRSVNGVLPDEDGNVKIETGTKGAVTSVNGVKPDEDGNVQIEVGGAECECEAATDDEIVEALFEMGALPAITDENGAILTDENNAILMV